MMATGCGKTRVFSERISRHWTQARGRSLVLAHRGDLVRQLAREVAANACLPCEIEMAEQRADGRMFAPPCVVASVQSISQPRRLARYDRDAFALIVVDEAHHAVSQSYRDVIAHFASAKVLGVTATPDRGDKRAMGLVFDTCAYVYDIRRGIREQYLSPIRQEFVAVEGLDAIASMRAAGDDIDDEELAALMEQESILHAIATPTIERMGDRPTVVFTASVLQARSLAVIFNRHRAGAAVALSGESTTEERQAAFEAFTAGRVQFLCNCNLVTEGVDLPSIAGVAMARPTRSRALYTQCVGRGLRLSPGKTDCHVLDFVGVSANLKLVSSVDVLGGGYSDSVQARARKILEDEGGEVDRVLARALEAERARELGLVASARFQTREVDPFAALPEPAPQPDPPAVLTKKAAHAARVLGVDLAAEPGPAPTYAQLGALQRADIETEGLTRPMAARLVAALDARRAHGLCTFKQARVLSRAKEATNVTFEQAKRLLDAIQANSWRPLSEEQRAAVFGAHVGA